MFSTFVVGNSSRFAHAACRAVADAPGKAYNPLFLYGGVGLGKTHLMQAIGHAVREGHRRPPKVAYVTSEKFMNEMIGSIQENRTSEFRTRYRTVDVLLIDDIQFLAGKDRTQEEFFHTFNALHEIQKQIVVSSDRPPKDIPTLEDRLRSRFEGGLMADIQPPDFETRLAILNTKLGVHSSLVPDDVCSFIAHKIQRNIRELEGALIRVLAHASINGRAVTVEAAQTILADIIPVGDSTPVSIELIQETVAAYFKISVEEMKGKRRDKHIVFPRQVAMYIVREETESSLPVIGVAFGGRDHTTALHAIEKITDLALEDARLQGDLRQIRQRIHQR
jgi:chromosomal replication initiator protein